ncbi:spirocyclase AveC family protein [Mycobacterium sp. pR1184]|uniref:spirocyclase AveC family protein n=1 Tax=Mycobacterium sp. pR1184 TaxID=3238981 RepID=UPI00351ABEAE
MVSPVYFEAFQLAGFVALCVYVIAGTRRRGELGYAGLLAIAGFSIFWQEFYADWGAYLKWNPDFHMLPWGPTPLTTPDKPVINLVAYPVFMATAFLSMLSLQRSVGRRWPSLHPLLLSLITAGPVLIFFNVVTEYISVATLGFWTYVDTVGPAMHSDAGTMPLLYPNIPFGLFGAVTAFLIGWSGSNGRPRFENMIIRSELPRGAKRDALRAVAWVLTFNVTYWLFLVTPCLLIRLAFGEPSTLVP